MKTAEPRKIANVAPSAIPSDRHSPRNANQSSPTPGVTFVNSTNAHVAGHRNPATIATARRSEMLPPMSSGSARITPSARSRGPVRKRRAPRRMPVQAATNACHGRSARGATSWRNAGE